MGSHEDTKRADNLKNVVREFEPLSKIDCDPFILPIAIPHGVKPVGVGFFAAYHRLGLWHRRAFRQIGRSFYMVGPFGGTLGRSIGHGVTIA